VVRSELVERPGEGWFSIVVEDVVILGRTVLVELTAVSMIDVELVERP